jgi:hypothetical protein
MILHSEQTPYVEKYPRQTISTHKDMHVVTMHGRECPGLCGFASVSLHLGHFPTLTLYNLPLCPSDFALPLDGPSISCANFFYLGLFDPSRYNWPDTRARYRAAADSASNSKNLRRNIRALSPWIIISRRLPLTAAQQSPVMTLSNLRRLQLVAKRPQSAKKWQPSWSARWMPTYVCTNDDT